MLHKTFDKCLIFVFEQQKDAVLANFLNIKTVWSDVFPTDTILAKHTDTSSLWIG